jgi:transposase-like protein
MRKHYTETQRAELIALVARGEASPRVAATRLGIPESTAYYWLKRSRRPPVAVVVTKAPRRPRPTTVPGFARLVPATAAVPEITIRIGDAAIAVAPDFDAELLRAVVAALTERAP